MTKESIRTTGLTKKFGAVTALDSLDWTVGRGSIAGVLGPNGAGKSTLAKLLLGITRASAGNATVLGQDVAAAAEAVRRRVALVPEDKLLYEEMRVGAFLRFYGSYFPAWDAAAARGFLKAWGIPERRRIRELSKGNRAKLVVGAALSRRPEVLLLDEPTIDLDPASVEEILTLLGQWVADGERSVVLNTHRVDEVERICDSILVLADGRTLASGDLDDLRASWKRIRAWGRPAEGTTPTDWSGVRRVNTGDGWTTLVVSGDTDAVLDRLRALGADNFEVEPIGLREIYLVLTDYRRGRLDDVLESVV
jgi:ABC-2 type transport system ATP-binding protein